MKKTTASSLFLIIFILTISIISSNAHAEISTVTAAINKAGHLRMLTQRMLKYYAMIGINVETKYSIKQLNDTIEYYNTQLEELKFFSPSPTVTQSLKQLEALWLPYQKVLTDPIYLENTEWLVENNDVLLSAFNKVVTQLQYLSGSNYAELINISGRQRLLSQRLATFYMLKIWGINNPTIDLRMQQAKSEFKSGLLILIDAKENSTDIQSALNEAKTQWELFEYGLNLEQNNKNPVPLIVAMTSEKVLIKMNEITSMYVNLSNKHPQLERTN